MPWVAGGHAEPEVRYAKGWWAVDDSHPFIGEVGRSTATGWFAVGVPVVAPPQKVLAGAEGYGSGVGVEITGMWIDGGRPPFGGLPPGPDEPDQVDGGTVSAPGGDIIDGGGVVPGSAGPWTAKTTAVGEAESSGDGRTMKTVKAAGEAVSDADGVLKYTAKITVSGEGVGEGTATLAEQGSFIDGGQPAYGGQPPTPQEPDQVDGGTVASTGGEGVDGGGVVEGSAGPSWQMTDAEGQGIGIGTAKLGAFVERPVQYTTAAGDGFSQATATAVWRRLPHAPVTTHYTAAATVVYSIPDWCDVVDVIVIGGGGGGCQGKTVVTGQGGTAGEWSARTLTKGIDIPPGITGLSCTVGAGGPSANNNSQPNPAGNGHNTSVTAAGVPSTTGLAGLGGGHTGSQRGEGAGNFVWNGVTYTGGTEVSGSQAARAPGGGGVGGGALNGSGGSGATGAVWLVARQIEGQSTVAASDGSGSGTKTPTDTTGTSTGTGTGTGHATRPTG
jgi:hypothetical protein